MKFLIGFIIMVSAVLSGEEILSTAGSKESVRLVVILMGPPGSGKGTHAAPLSKRLGIPHISTGDLFRENIRNETQLGKKAGEYIQKGQLVPDSLVLDMLFNRIKAADCKQGYILDGFPRTLAQAQALDARLQGSRSRVIAVNLQISDDLLLERITGRMSCKGCNQLYHKTYSPPKKNTLCDSCQGILYQRDDDKAEILIKRLEVYHEQANPLISYYRSKKGGLKEVSAEQSPSQVFESVVESILEKEPAIAGSKT